MDPRAFPFWLPLLAVSVAAQTPDTAAWMHRPDIRAVRLMVVRLDSVISAGRMRERDTIATCYGGAARFDITLHTDTTGMVRRLRLRGGTGDSAHDLAYYYDDRGHLRFAFAGRGAVNGTQEEERVYFGESGDLLHREVRRIAGPGWPWDPVVAITDPRQWLRSPCE